MAISKKILKSAAEKGLINSNQIEPLYDFLKHNTSAAILDNTENEEGQTEEPLKFIRSFGDVFITLGIVLLVIAINMLGLTSYYYIIPVAIFVVLAEWLIRIRRLVLPGMAILISILYFVHQAFGTSDEQTGMIQLLITAITSLIFYLRYKMPFSLLPLAGSVVAMIVMQIGLDVLKHPGIFVGLGICVLAVALWFDSRDTGRVSHLSDSAFWLHLLAAPLIVHGVMLNVLDGNSFLVELMSRELLIILFFVFFFLLALFIDRRAMLVATQLYVIYALTGLLKENINSAQDVMIYVLVGLGLFVIYFGTYWYKTRYLIFGAMSKYRVSQYFPPMNKLDINKK